MENSLRDRLKSLGVQAGMKKLAEINIDRTYPIQTTLSGDFILNSFGETFLHTETFVKDYQQGDVILSPQVGITTLARWAKTPQLERLSSRDLVFLDTETTGLSGGTGTFIFLVGIGFQTEDGFQVKQFFLRNPAEETAFLSALDESVSGFQGLVTFNGKSFDVPILRTRHTLNGFTSPFSTMNHIDLLPLARRLWKYRLSNRNLGVLETEILKMERSSEEIPGWMVPEMYIDYCRNGDSRPLKGVFYHNAMDIVSLAGLLINISDLMDSEKLHERNEGIDIMAVGKLYESLGDDPGAKSFYETALQKPMEPKHRLLAEKSYALLCKRKGKWDLSIPIWKNLAVSGDWDSCVELAKYYEHTLGDYFVARYYTELSLDNIKHSSLPAEKMNFLKNELMKRRSRLDLKIEKNAKK
jgi:uncharacterized protein YprB with RNaseH-like and TPR domain